MRLTLSLLVLLFATEVVAQELAPSDIVGLKVNATATMAMRTRASGREYSGRTLLRWSIDLKPHGEIKGRQLRTYSSGGAVKGKREYRIDVTIGTPKKYAEGDVVWLLQQNNLIRLNTTPVGGWKLTIGLSKAGASWTCKASYEPFLEVGKGRSRNLGVEQGAQGQIVEIISASMVKSSCAVQAK